jgi:probable phosphoglycerate mutase
MRLFIIRHADPDYPNNTITPAGHLEAAALGRRMGKLGLDRIYCSPLGRARDTARYTADALGMKPVIEPWTAELSWAHIGGDYGMGAPWDIHGHVIRQPNLDLTRENWYEFPPLDNPAFREGFAHVQANSDDFLARHGYEREGGVYHIRQANREKIAVFCHGGFGLTWLAHLLHLPLPLVWIGFFLPPSSVTTILFEERNADIAVPRCLGMGDLSHLYAEGLEMQPAGIKANTE